MPEKVADVKREKEIYKIPPNEFIEGEWLDLVKQKSRKATKFDVEYKNGFLTIVFLFENKREVKRE